MCTANSGGGVDSDDGLNFCITICGISLIFGNCRFNRNFATVILFQMTSPITTAISMASSNSGTITAAAMSLPLFRIDVFMIIMFYY